MHARTAAALPGLELLNSSGRKLIAGRDESSCDLGLGGRPLPLLVRAITARGTRAAPVRYCGAWLIRPRRPLS
jgi:hypothetical protein